MKPHSNTLPTTYSYAANVTELPCPWQFFPTKFETIGNTGSDWSFDRVLIWLSRCVSSHQCGGDTFAGPMPKRVLDVHQDEQDEQDVRLCQPGGEREKYVCLSHCWGDARTFITTTSNLSSRLKSIAWDNLPKTYKEAIQIVRKLDVRYIWIDSLCIVQDDREDWLQESKSMAAITKTPT
jgi:Heterokaryon incompatibility protein (HET)